MKKPVVRLDENPSRFRQFILWFKPNWRMSFEEYVDHYFRLNPARRQKLREMSGKDGLTKKRFKFMAKQYYAIYGPKGNILDHNAIKEGLSELNLPHNAVVASFGAGNMHHECFLAKEFPQISLITGVEPLKEMRDLTPRTVRNILGFRSKKIRNTDGTFENAADIPTNSVDAVISNEAFHHVKNAEDALQHMTSKIKSGGGIIIVYRPDYRTNPISPQTVRSLLGKFGFRVIKNQRIQNDSKEPDNNIQLIVAMHQS